MPCPQLPRILEIEAYAGRVVIDHALFGLVPKAVVRFELPDGSVFERRTDGVGGVEAPNGTATARVVVGLTDGSEIRMFCALSPLETSSDLGLWQRLRNLG